MKSCEVPGENIPQSEELEPPCPKITYDDEFYQGKAPYSIKINPLLFGKLLSEQGFPYQRIRNIEIRVHFPKPADKFIFSILGEEFSRYRPFKDVIDLYPGMIWEYCTELKDKTKTIAGRKPPEDKEINFEDFLVTKRVSDYLSKAPRERALEFIDRLLDRAAERKLVEASLHETSHATRQNELQIARLRMELIPALVSTAFALTNHQDFLQFLTTYTIISALYTLVAEKIFHNKEEKRANSFWQEMRNDPRWQNLVEFKPKLG